MSNDSSIPGKGRIVNKGNGNLRKLQVAWSYRSTKQEVEKYGAGRWTDKSEQREVCSDWQFRALLRLNCSRQT